MMHRPSRGSPARSKARAWVAAGAAVAVLAGLWLVWPSGRVKNRDSRGTTLIAFGDSLTAGYGAGEGEDFPSRLAALLHREVLNAGVSGDTTEMALARLENDVLARDPKLVIVGLGGNDFLQSVPLATTEANLRSIVRRIQQRGAMVILLGYRFPSLQNNYGAMYERIADDEECLLVPDLLDGILSDSSLKSDEIHPNARGYAMLAERIAPSVNKLIK
ncbi:MAG TPA: arylesterase [Thermoanaerobaculia bacterium]|nr:arylesterase [Thermoanaerobaculia bacterium]